MQQNRIVMGRRAFLGATAATASAGLLAACSGGSEPSGGQAGAATPSKQTITLADWSNGNTAVPDAAAAYKKKTGVTVNFQAPVSYDDYSTRFRTVLSGNNPPDVVRVDDDFVAQYAAEGGLADLNRYIKAQHFDKDEVTANLYDFTVQDDGAQAALAIGIHPRIIFYNKTMFREKGVPLPPATWTDEAWKWDDFLAAAKKLTDHDNGVWGSMILNDVGYEQTFSWNNGGEGTFSKNGKKFTLADKQGIEAMQWLADLTNKHHVQPPYGTIKQTNAPESLFTSQKLGMLFTSSGDVPYFQKNATDFEWDIAAVPGQVRQATAGSMIVYAVPAHSKRKADGFAFLAFLCSEEAGKIYVDGHAFTPANKAAAKLVKGTAGSSPAHYDLLSSAVAHNHARNRTLASAAAAKIYQPAMEQVWNGEKTAKEVLDSVRDKVDAALANGGS